MYEHVDIFMVQLHTSSKTDKKWPEKLRRYAPIKGNQEKTDRIIDIDIIDIIDNMDTIES